MGASWASLDPCRRSWCCLSSVLVGAASPIHRSTDVGFTSFAVVSGCNSVDNALKSGLSPRESAQCQVGGCPSEYVEGFDVEGGGEGIVLSQQVLQVQVRRSESFCYFVGASAAIMPPILAAWRRCSSSHKPHPPRSAGMNKASFCQSSSSVNPEIRFAAFRTVSSTDTQISFVESDPAAGCTRSLYRWEASVRVVSNFLDVLG